MLWLTGTVEDLKDHSDIDIFAAEESRQECITADVDSTEDNIWTMLKLADAKEKWVADCVEDNDAISIDDWEATEGCEVTIEIYWLEFDADIKVTEVIIVTYWLLAEAKDIWAEVGMDADIDIGKEAEVTIVI